MLREARTDVETIKTLAKKYPDLHMNTESVEKELAAINAAYENVVRETRKRN
jgi:predicted patatin/cPLA2 family phospholipase